MSMLRPKGRQYRRFRLSAPVVDRVKTHVADHGLGHNDLIFYSAPPQQHHPPTPDATTLGLTALNGALEPALARSGIE